MLPFTRKLYCFSGAFSVAAVIIEVVVVVVVIVVLLVVIGCRKFDGEPCICVYSCIISFHTKAVYKVSKPMLPHTMQAPSPL